MEALEWTDTPSEDVFSNDQGPRLGLLGEKCDVTLSISGADLTDHRRHSILMLKSHRGVDTLSMPQEYGRSVAHMT